MRNRWFVSAMISLFAFSGPSPSLAQTTSGHTLDPTAANLTLTWSNASVVLPPSLTGGSLWQGMLRQLPIIPQDSGKYPLVILMHGSSGNAPAIKDFQRWLAQEMGLPSIAPDSMAIPDRLTYTSPIDKATYERVHALRLAELKNAFEQAQSIAWVRMDSIILIGTSEGSVPVGRFDDPRPRARIVYSWSCEQNYFVEAPHIGIPKATPVLSVIAAKDPYFSAENPWNKGLDIKGTCTGALKDHTDAVVVTLLSDKHTIMNFQEAHDVTKAFLIRILSSTSP